RRFLRRHGGLEDREGPIVDGAGRTLGRHRGHHHFTVGQRRGIGVSAPEPLYVVSKDSSSNTVTVGPRADLQAMTVTIRNAVLHRDGSTVDAARLRYRATAVPAAVRAGTGSHEVLE